jgi:hypothetical protein
VSDIPPFNLVESFEVAPAFRTVAAPAPAPAGPVRGDRWRAAGHWLRDTGLGITGFLVVLAVALSGWTASFIGLHQFGHQHMDLSSGAAWLVPITFDGAAGGLSLVVFRASINGRGASLWRFLIVTFTVLSSWINWEHIGDPTGRWIASFMPPSAVILFEGLMSEARAAAARRDGSERPRVHSLRWFMDRPGTWAIYRAYVLGIELPDALKQAAAKAADGPVRAPVPPTRDTPLPPTETPAEAVAEAPTEDAAPVDQNAGETVDGNQPQPTPGTVDRPADRTTDRTAAKPSPASRRKPVRAVAGKKAPRRSLNEWVELAAPVFHAEFARLKRMPTANEFATAIKDARLGIVSDTRAKSIRAEILDRAELPSLDGEN